MKRIKLGEGFLILLFWIFIWWLISKAADNFIVPSPLETGRVLAGLLLDPTTYIIILSSLSRVLLSLIIGILLGVVFGILAGVNEFVYKLLVPVVNFITATPVVSFIIILFMYIKNDSLVPVICGILLCFPIIYNNVLHGYKMVSDELVSMSSIYRVPMKRRIMKLYIPSTLPYLFAGVLTSIGICWKATIAAELIGIIGNSIGLQLYNGKVFLEYDHVFAWTLLIVACSVIIQKVAGYAIRRINIYERFKVI